MASLKSEPYTHQPLEIAYMELFEELSHKHISERKIFFNIFLFLNNKISQHSGDK